MHLPAEVVLPVGYRFRLRWAFLPIRVAGRLRWMETVRIVQRYEGERDEEGNPSWVEFRNRWHDVGFWDEVVGLSHVDKPAEFAEV